jgi:hypothetical protein
MPISAASLNSTWWHVPQAASFIAAADAIMPQRGIKKYSVRLNAEQHLRRRSGQLETTGEAPGSRGASNCRDRPYQSHCSVSASKLYDRHGQDKFEPGFDSFNNRISDVIVTWAATTNWMPDRNRPALFIRCRRCSSAE